MTGHIITETPYRVQTTDGHITDDCRTRSSAIQAARHRAQYMNETFLVMAWSECGWKVSEIVAPS